MEQYNEYYSIHTVRNSVLTATGKKKYIIIMTLADKLKKLRIKHKMSMSQVARLSRIASDHRGKITQGYISRLESGKETNPSLLKLLTLCDIYKVKPNELFLNTKRKKLKTR